MVSIQLAFFDVNFSRERAKNIVDSLKLFCYVEPNSKQTKERTQWQPEKEARSPEARAKVVRKRQRRARQNPSQAEAPRSPATKVGAKKGRRKQQAKVRRNPRRS